MPEKIFNYRLSRARGVVGNTFGIAAARWRLLRTTMMQKYDNVVTIVSAICVSHNFCMKECSNIYTTQAELNNAQWEDQSMTHDARADQNIATVRKVFEEFFVREGEVEW